VIPAPGRRGRNGHAATGFDNAWTDEPTAGPIAPVIHAGPCGQ